MPLENIQAGKQDNLPRPLQVWIASGLAWLPLAILMTGAALETINPFPLGPYDGQRETALVLTGGLLMGWLATGAMSNASQSQASDLRIRLTMLWVCSSMICVLHIGFFAIGVLTGEIAGDFYIKEPLEIAADLSALLSLVVPFLWAYALAKEWGVKVSGEVALAILAGLVIGGLPAYGVVLIFAQDSPISVLGAHVPCTLIAVLVISSVVIQRLVKTGSRLKLFGRIAHLSVAVIAAAAYAALVWISFFGGWMAIARLGWRPLP